MDGPFLVIEDSFFISGRGTVVLPATTPEAVGTIERAYITQVRLVRPDGTEEVVTGKFSWTHFNPGGYKFVCQLPDVTKEQVPAGTQVWLIGVS